MADRNHDEFVLQIIGAQSRLYAYVLSLVLNRDRAADILQQANLVMLEKEPEFQPGTNFVAWAHRVVFYEVLADRRNRQRDKHLFSDELLASIAARSEHIDQDYDQRAQQLEACMRSLSEEHREVIRQRYRPGGSVAELAKQMGRTPAAMSALLYRIRTLLVECVQRKLQGAASQ